MKSNYRDTFDEWFKETTVLSDTAALFGAIYYELRNSMEARMAELIGDDEGSSASSNVKIHVVKVPSDPVEAQKVIREAIEKGLSFTKA